VRLGLSQILTGSLRIVLGWILSFIKLILLRKVSGARFSSGTEQRRILRSTHKGVLIDGDKKALSKRDSFEHIAVIAKPGGGKSSAYIIPNILHRAKNSASMITLDPSGELFKATSGELSRRGYRILSFNPGEPDRSSRFNPFYGLGAGDLAKIGQICASIVLTRYGQDADGALWNDGAISILEIFAKCLAFDEDPKKLNLVNINVLLQRFGADGKDLDEWICEHSINPLDPTDRTVYNEWCGLISSNPRMLSSYTTIAKTSMKQLNDPGIQSLVCDNEIDFQSFRQQKTILYIIVPGHEQSYYQFLIDVLYTRFFNQMMEQLPNPSDLDIYCFLDEFGNSYIDDFSSKINLIRKYRVSLSIVMQSVSQLNAKYGLYADSTKGGIGTYLVFSGADHETAKEICDSIGKVKIKEQSEFWALETRYHEHNLINPDEIRTLNENQVLLLSKNRYPFILEVTPYYKNTKFSRYSKINPITLSSKLRATENTISI